MSTPSTPATARRRGLARWTVAAAATAALVISGSGLVAFAQSGGGASQGPQFAPPGTIAYVEARLDLPAGQEDALAQMMTAFPGFADAGAFGMKKDEVLAMLADQLGATGIDGDLVGDVLTGEVGIALGGLDAMLMGDDPSLVVGLAVADAAAAGSVLDGLMAGATEPPVETTYNDVIIRTDESSEPPASIALTDDWVLLGTSLELVEQSIDALAGTAPSLADDEAFQEAWSRLPDARIGGAWMDFSSLGSLMDMATGMAAGQTGMAMPELDLAAILPQDMTAALVAEPDRLSLDVALTSGEMTPDLPVRESDLALSFPADTQVYVEAREVGTAIESGLTGLIDTLQAQAVAGDPSLDTSGVSDIVAALGPDGPFTALLQGVTVPEFLNFVGDIGIGVGLSSDGLWLGIVGQVDDPAVAEARVSNVISLLTGLTLGMEDQGVSITTADVDGVAVTTINLPLDSAIAGSGMALSTGDRIEIALDGDRLLIGLGDFVRTALASDGTDSLGTSAGYVDALAEDTANSGVLYVNVSSLLSVLDPMLSMMGPEWEQIAPYATGLDRIIAVGTASDEVIEARMTVIVGQ